LYARDGAITAREPLIARLDISNESSEEIRIWSAGVFLDVYDEADSVVATMPRPRGVRNLRLGARKMAPREVYSRFLIVTGMCQFESPGLYAVRAQHLAPSQELSVLCEDAVSLQVLPYNAARLEAACDELFAPIRKRSSSGAIPMGVRTKALYSIRDDVVLPYLDWLVRERNAEYAARAMRRIGTPRAENLLTALAARTDEAGEAARQALEMSLEPTQWDVEGE
jgi:hypothetical protein